jgi:hypothetical protein
MVLTHSSSSVVSVAWVKSALSPGRLTPTSYATATD